jgi:hypothetical protein
MKIRSKRGKSVNDFKPLHPEGIENASTDSLLGFLSMN